MSATSLGETSPLCPHFGPCGGCQLQHLLYPTQLALKHDRLTTLLAEAEIPTPPPVQTHAADPWHYRNRIRLRVEASSEGTFALGYNRGNTNDFLPIHTCPISAPLLLDTAQRLVALAPVNPTHAKWLAAIAELELFTTPDESHLQLTLLLRTAPDISTDQVARTFTALCEALHQHIPQLTGAGAELLRSTHANAPRPRASRRAAANFTAPTWGSPGLRYPVTLNRTPEQLWVSRASFFQVNGHLVDSLVAVATQNVTSSQPEAIPGTSSSRPKAAGRSGEIPFVEKLHSPTIVPTAQPLAWDLFAGVGLFTRALAPYFTRIVAVESAPAATADLAAARLPNLRIVTSTVLDFLRIAALDRDRPDLVLLDPPRAGLGLEAATLLAHLRPARIVYVSCDPITLARDLAAMLSSGYNLAELHLVDMFPQTSHQETVAILDRSDDESKDRNDHQTPPAQG